jgi:metallo-beta-lactamase family protein
LRIHGEDVPIRAEVVVLDSLSAHADRTQIMAWLRDTPAPPAQTFITHGELDASDSLRLSITRTLGWDARVPEWGEVVNVPAVGHTPLRSPPAS